MAEARAASALGAPGGAAPGPPLLRLGLAALRGGRRRLRNLRAHPAGPRTWLFLGGALGLCEAAGLDPSLGVVGAIAGGLPQSPLLPGGARGGLALLLFASGLWLLLGLILRLGLRLLLGGTAGVLGGGRPPPRLWMALVRMFAGRRPRLLSFQGVLPPLPLPPLHQTLRGYLASLEPLGPRGPREEAAALAQIFGGAAGPRLQRWLRLRSWLLPCYLSELWEEHVYLRARGPLPINSTYYVMDLLGPPPTRLQAARAANATFGLLRFRDLVQGGGLPPVLFGGALPLCSAQYGRIFDSARVPGERVDRLWRGGDGGHVAVARGGQFFRVAVRWGGRPLTPRELQAQFQRVLEEAGGGGGGATPSSPPTPPPPPGGAGGPDGRGQDPLGAGSGGHPGGGGRGRRLPAGAGGGCLRRRPRPPPRNRGPGPPPWDPPPRPGPPQPPGAGGRGQGAAARPLPRPLVRQILHPGGLRRGAHGAERGAVVGGPPRGGAPLGVHAGHGRAGTGLRGERGLQGGGRARPAPPPAAALGDPRGVPGGAGGGPEGGAGAGGRPGAANLRHPPGTPPGHPGAAGPAAGPAEGAGAVPDLRGRAHPALPGGAHGGGPGLHPREPGPGGRHGGPQSRACSAPGAAAGGRGAAAGAAGGGHGGGGAGAPPAGAGGRRPRAGAPPTLPGAGAGAALGHGLQPRPPGPAPAAAPRAAPRGGGLRPAPPRRLRRLLRGGGRRRRRLPRLLPGLQPPHGRPPLRRADPRGAAGAGGAGGGGVRMGTPPQNKELGDSWLRECVLRGGVLGILGG